MSATSTELPEGTIIEEYDAVSDLLKGTVKNGEAVLEEGDILNGQRHGTWMSYFSDGSVQKITSFLHGKKQGPEIVFDQSGSILSKSSYVQGNMHGEYRAYNRGKIVEKKSYKNGKLHGAVRKYYTGGNIMEESNYVDGTIDGEAKWYNQAGEVTITYIYDMGELVDDGK